MKISINRELIVNAAELLWTCKPLDVESARRILLDILEDNPAPITKQLTPEETVEFLIEITDTLAAYLWNKKEETTTHTYAKYLDELREKLEEYNS